MQYIRLHSYSSLPRAPYDYLCFCWLCVSIARDLQLNTLAQTRLSTHIHAYIHYYTLVFCNSSIHRCHQQRCSVAVACRSTWSDKRLCRFSVFLLFFILFWFANFIFAVRSQLTVDGPAGGVVHLWEPTSISALAQQWWLSQYHGTHAHICRSDLI